LGKLGYFATVPPIAMVLPTPWKSFDQYLAAMNKKARKRINDHLKEGAGLEFELRDSFRDLADTAHRLYENVFAQPGHVGERATPAFFAGLSDFDQAKLLVARKKGSPEVLGVNLLLFGDTIMQNLFIGFDYEENCHHAIYFNLVERSLRIAMERGVRVCFLGQDSYDFKARLGARPVPLVGYMKHRLWPMHWLLRCLKAEMFPKEAPPVHSVFKDEGE